VRLIYRQQRNLLQLVNIGVPFSSYVPRTILDPGSDGLEETADDRTLSVFDQDASTLGQDRFLLTNPAHHNAVHRGLQVALAKTLATNWSFQIDFSAFKSTAATNPGNRVFENDPGVPGRLFDNPNTLINAYGRLFFDRAYTARIAAYYVVPFGIRLACMAKYYDGRPFGRKLIIRNLTQSPFYVMATPRGQPGGFRTESHANVDLRAEKEFLLSDRKRLSVIVDIYNLLNGNNKTIENDLTGPEFPERIALEFMSPRSVHLGLRLRF
jgi:hypothetical protein